MNGALATRNDTSASSVEIRVRGRVQGVGFRPTVWRYANDLGLRGEVLNDGEGVLIRACGAPSGIKTLVDWIERSPPPLAAISAIEVMPFAGVVGETFRIVRSAPGATRTEVAPDAAICAQCEKETLDPFSRRFRYPFTNCTHCGPRLTIVRSMPYDRSTTTMAPFALCPACAGEYADPADRRFHAEPIACHVCGPGARLIRFDGGAVSFEQHSMLDDVDAAMGLIQKGEIVAIKALGGYQIACDATRADAVAELRRRKRRDAKPFALMARDLDVIRRYATVQPIEEEALRSAAAPIVLLDGNGPEQLPETVAPGLTTLGFMLPSTPLHVMMFRRMARPVVMTSGNLSEEPQAIDDAQASQKLQEIAPYALVHDRAIANRVDDSVVRRMGGTVRTLRRARGYAPGSIALPPGFERAPEILAYGAELKATFCLVKDGRAALSQHQGDLADAATFADYRKNLDLFGQLCGHRPGVLACDSHPEYISTKLAKARAASDGLALAEVQHHHAHIAACLAENGRSLDAPPALGVALDGLGYGADGALWGGEFLLCDYRDFERVGTFKPVAMAGGEQAAREPWRNLYAHLMAEMGSIAFAMNYSDLALFTALKSKPLATIDAMMRSGLNSPLASSCGRLFDAVAAALGLCFDRQAYEGEAAARLEAIVSRSALEEEGDELAYPFAIPNLKGSGLAYVEPLAMWSALLGDLILATPVSTMAARFHKGLARALAAMAEKLARRGPEGEARFDTVALSGGCFQNRVLFEETVRRLEARKFAVLVHGRAPANDGGISLGQAAIAAARFIDEEQMGREERATCA